MGKHTQRTLISFSTGLLLGTCCSVISIALFYFQQENQTTPLPIPSKLVLPTATDANVPALIYSTPTGTKENTVLEINEVLSIAEKYILEGKLEEAKETLLPNVDTWESNHDKARGYKLLGDGEVNNGHYQLAAPITKKCTFTNQHRTIFIQLRSTMI